MSGAGCYILTTALRAPATEPIYYCGAANAPSATLLQARPGFKSPIWLLQSWFDCPFNCSGLLLLSEKPFIYILMVDCTVVHKKGGQRACVARTISWSIHGPPKWTGTIWTGALNSEHLQQAVFGHYDTMYLKCFAIVFVLYCNCICLILYCIYTVLNCNNCICTVDRCCVNGGCCLCLLYFFGSNSIFIVFKLYLYFCFVFELYFQCICRATSYRTERGRRL